MDRYFYILNHRLLPTPYTHRFFVEKFAKGFTYHGYTVKVIEHAEEIQGPGFLMISSSPFFFFWNNGLKSVRRDFFMVVRKVFEKLHLAWFSLFCIHLQKRAVKEIAPRLLSQKVTVIAWDWHTQKHFFDSLDIPIIYTNEYFYGEPQQASKQTWKKFYEEHADHALPIRFLADYDPQKVGDLVGSQRSIVVSYVGERRYSLDWQDAFRDRDDCVIIPTPPYIDEERRVAIYQHSLISLGLQSPQNIADRVVSERVFEALAFGVICISSHPDAPKATDGAALYASSVEDLVKKVGDLSSNVAEAESIRKRGFAFIKGNGTYAHEAQKFIDLDARMSGRK